MIFTFDPCLGYFSDVAAHNLEPPTWVNLNILLVSDPRGSTFPGSSLMPLLLQMAEQLPLSKEGPAINTPMTSCCVCICICALASSHRTKARGMDGRLYGVESLCGYISWWCLFFKSGIFCSDRERDQLIPTHNIIVSFMGLSVLQCLGCVWDWKNFTVCEGICVKQSILKLPQSERVQLMSRLLRNEFSWFFRLKWREDIVTGGKAAPEKECSHSQSAPTPLPNTFTKKGWSKWLVSSVPSSSLFWGLIGSTRQPSRGLHTGESQLECARFASSVGSKRRRPDAPVNIYCSNKIHHSLPSALRQHA